MNDVAGNGASPSARATTAGGLLRQARQAQGLHIAALAAAIKVVPRKLELLETDQFDQLPDATFTRALAQTVCRTLKIDAVPILALLPPPSGYRLEQVSEGLNTPFRERPGRLEPKEWVTIGSPTLWIVGLLVVATIAVYFAPAGWLPFPKSAVTRAPVEAPATAAPVAESVPAVAPQSAAVAASSATEGAPLDVPATATVSPAQAAAPVAPAVAGILQLRTTGESWVEITDSRGQALIARTLQPGESVGFDGSLPFKLKIGNAGATEAAFRGQPLDLGPFTRDNVARLELK